MDEVREIIGGALKAKVIFPGDVVSTGKKLNVCHREESFSSKVTGVRAMEGNKFMVWLENSTRLCWLRGVFHLQHFDGDQVVIELI